MRTAATERERERMDEKSTRVCVTGAAGHIGSSLVKKLLERGHVVHATVRNLGEHSKTELLTSLPGADARLVLFEADIYEPDSFEPAIQGCQFVFLVATPLQHNAHSSQFKDTTEAAVAAIQTILHSCERSGTVKRVIFTGSVSAASTLKEDGSGYRESMDESCWTPLNLSLPDQLLGDFEKNYVSSKTQSEKELLSYNDNKVKRGMEVVSLVCGVVGGDTLLPYVPWSVQILVSPFTGNGVFQRQMACLQTMLGSVPMVHINDVCDAHAFCMEVPSMSGRFLCASYYPTMQEFVDYCKQKYPEIRVIKEIEGNERRIGCGSTKLVDMGFRYCYDEKQILDDSVACAKRLGGL